MINSDNDVTAEKDRDDDKKGLLRQGLEKSVRDVFTAPTRFGEYIVDNFTPSYEER